jgi:hypothetical protein
MTLGFDVFVQLVMAAMTTEPCSSPEERVLRVRQRDAVLGPPRAGEAGLDIPEVELDDLRVRRLVLLVVPEQVLLAVRLDERDALLRATGESQVLERDVVDGEEAARRAVLRGHVPDRRPVGERKVGDARAEVLDELPDDARLAEDLRDGEDQVRRGRALAQRAGEAEADHLRYEHRDGLAEHRRLGLDPADAPAEDAEAVDHRRVRVGADERVRVGAPLAVLLADEHRLPEVLEVHLVADAGPRRDDAEVPEGVLPPAEELIALLVALELVPDVEEERRLGPVLVHLHRVVDHEVHGLERVDALRVAAQADDRVAHRRQVHDRGDAGEVLEEDPRDAEGDLPLGRLRHVPAGQGVDVRALDEGVVLVPEQVLEEDLEREGEAVHRRPRELAEPVEAKDCVLGAADGERVAAAVGVE